MPKVTIMTNNSGIFPVFQHISQFVQLPQFVENVKSAMVTLVSAHRGENSEFLNSRLTFRAVACPQTVPADFHHSIPRPSRLTGPYNSSRPRKYRNIQVRHHPEEAEGLSNSWSPCGAGHRSPSWSSTWHLHYQRWRSIQSKSHRYGEPPEAPLTFPTSPKSWGPCHKRHMYPPPSRMEHPTHCLGGK